MHFVRSLRFRVAASFALLGAGVSIILSIGLYLAGQELERRLIAESLADELEEYANVYRQNSDASPIATKTIRSYVRSDASDQPVPEKLRRLDPGVHELTLEGQDYYAAVEDRGPDRFYMLYSQARLDPRGRELAGFLVAGVVVTTLSAAVGGLWLARRVISPVTVLARRVSRLRPEDRPAPHAGGFTDDEVGELARAFDRYYERLQAFIEREHAFTGDVSHELRTSLAVINGAVEVLLTRETLPPAVQHPVERIRRAAREMSEITEALLVLAREAEQRESLRTLCVVDEVLKEVIDDHRHLLAGKPVEVKLEVHENVELSVERALVRIAIGNLVRNAFSYTEQGHIRVRLEPERLTIQDTGPGIENGRVSKVFRRNYRGNYGRGAGIGLSLVKRICDRYGWEISFESAVGAGTKSRLSFAARSATSTKNA